VSEIGCPPLLSAALDGMTVADVMHEGVVSCAPDASLRTVARLLASYRVHAVVVFPRHHADAGHVSRWKVISVLDLVKAAAKHDVDEGTAADAAGSTFRCIQPDEPLATAVLTMLAQRISHLVVVDRPHGRPIGVVSMLDVARALAGVAPPAEALSEA